ARASASRSRAAAPAGSPASPSGSTPPGAPAAAAGAGGSASASWTARPRARRSSRPSHPRAPWTIPARRLRRSQSPALTPDAGFRRVAGERDGAVTRVQEPPLHRVQLEEAEDEDGGGAQARRVGGRDPGRLGEEVGGVVAKELGQGRLRRPADLGQLAELGS